MNMRKRNWILAALVLAAAAIAAAWWWNGRPQPMSWRTGEVTRGPVEIAVTATGSLEAVTTVEVGTQVSGIISALYADFNSRVTKGQVIARLDSTLLYATLLDARSGLERVSAQEAQARAERDRMRALHKRDLVSRADLDAAEAAHRVAAANVSSARAQVERAEINLRYATITSPIDGIVLSRDVDIGQTVAASLSAPTLFVIAEDLSRMRVQAAVDEADIGRLRVGQKATFTVDAYPDTVFAGTVEQVRLQPQVVQNVVSYNVLLRAENPDLRLMPGMTASLSIVTARRDDALRVPAAALRFTPPGEQPAPGPGAAARARRPSTEGQVHVLENGVLRPVKVRTGLSDGNRTEITEVLDGGKLEPGMQVVTGMAGGAGPAVAAGTPFGMPSNRGMRR